MAAQKRKQTPLWVIIVISVIGFAACTNVGSSASSKKSEITMPTVELATPSEVTQGPTTQEFYQVWPSDKNVPCS